MYLKKIYLSNFRNYDELLLDFNSGINIIYGDNAQGKTNLLESIYVLGLTKSHRSFIDNNLIKEGIKYSQIKGIISENEIDTTYEIQLNTGKNKILKINEDNIKRVNDYVSNINIIIFYPDDLELIKGSPSIRRRFINLEISQLYSNYLNILAEYNQILKMRNDYIKLINQGQSVDMNYFQVLTDYYIDKSILIYQYRYKFIEKLNDISKKIFYDISLLDGFNIKYKTSFNFESYDNTDSMKNIISEKVKKIYSTEIKLKSTIYGPHKDDLEFYINDKNIKNYGSQGQQRMTVLAIKLAEISIFKEITNKYPILLLDDVFSELDEIRKNNLLKYIQHNIQTIITTTDLDNIDKSIKDDSKLIYIKNGSVIDNEVN